MTIDDIPADSEVLSWSPADLAANYARTKWLVQDARPKQLLPPGEDWDTCIWIAGRFFGKSRTIVEAGWWEAWRQPNIRIHALSPTLGDIRRTMFEGESGFLAKMPPEIIKSYNKTDKEIHLINGSMISGFSVVEEADRLRGPQAHHVLFDEAAAADRPAGNLEAAWRVAVLGCRLPCPDGSPSLKLIATTPRPIPFLKRLIKQPNVRVVYGTSHENLKNVAVGVRNELLALEGTIYGKQEIYGQFIDEDDTGILKRSWFKLWPADKKLPEFAFIVEVYDTATSEENHNVKTQKTDPSGSIVLGVFNTNQAFSAEERKRMGIRHKYAAILCDAWTERMGFPDLLDKARVQHRVKWGSPGRRADIVLIEDKSSGPSLRQVLMTYGVPCWPYNPGQQSKTMRMHAASPYIKQGALFVPESGVPSRKGLVRDWVEPFLEQVCAFNGKGSVEHDEFVDCVLGDTGIYTKRGLVPMRSVVVGDEVLTHENRWRKVLATGSRMSDHYYRLQAQGLDEIGLTGNHKVLTMKVAASQRKGKEARGLEWRRTDELKRRPTRKMTVKGRVYDVVSRVIHDTLLMPRLKADPNNTVIDMARYFPDGGMKITDDQIIPLAGKRIPIPRFLPLDNEAGWAMGLFVAEGCVSGHQIIWGCDHAAIERCASWAAKAFGRPGSIDLQRPYMTTFSLGATAALPLFKEFGYMANAKKVPAWCLTAPEEFVQGFVDGYAHGDGHRYRGRRVNLTSVSHGLLFGIRLMLARLGIPASRTEGKPPGLRNVFGKQLNCQQSYTLTYTDEARSWVGNVTPDYIGSHIVRCERAEAEVEVFNLSVEEDESYLTVGGLVHNCLSSGIAYLKDRNMLEATPEEKYLDLEEKREHEEREALRLQAREKPRVNPYG